MVKGRRLQRLTSSSAQQELSVGSRGRWAGPPTAGNGPGWAGWTQNCHCYCESDLLKEARWTGRLGEEEREDSQIEIKRDRGKGTAEERGRERHKGK